MIVSGAQLVAARTRRKLSQGQVAERLGVHRSSINVWEQGRTAIPPARVPQLEAFLGSLGGVEPEVRTCAQCGAVLTYLSMRTRFCGNACRCAYWRKSAAVPSALFAPPPPRPVPAGESPRAWDGGTQYSESPLIKRWRAYCVSCGGEEWMRGTDAQARATGPLRPCAACGGTRWLEEDVVSRQSAVELVAGGAA